MFDTHGLTVSLNPHRDVVSTLFTQQTLAQGLHHITSRGWRSDVMDLPKGFLSEKFGHTILHSIDQSELMALVKAEKFKVFGLPPLLFLDVHHGYVAVSVAAMEDQLSESVVAIFSELLEVFPESETESPDHVPIIFWTHSDDGARSYNRRLVVPTWDSIQQNYTANVGRELEDLLNGQFKPARGGQLLLWHGKPGTGKTYAIRAAASEWRDWCRVEYITDPERFFGGSDYMLEVLLQEADAEPAEGVGQLFKRSEPIWRLLVLEDAGELLSATAKKNTGQGLSRMLNSVDGLIGQGLRFMVLITTNEPLKEIHPAVARPGRCAAEIEFKEFSREEAKTWLGEYGQQALLKEGMSSRTTLAELYASIEGFKAAKGSSQRQVGLRTGGGTNGR